MHRWFFILLGAGMLLPPSLNALELPRSEEHYQTLIRVFHSPHEAEAKVNLKNLEQEFANSRWSASVRLRLADLETDPEKALDQYRAVIRENGESEWTLQGRWSLANLLFSLGKFQEALEQYAILAKGEHPYIWPAEYRSALCQMGLEQLVQARTRLELIAQQGPEEWRLAASIKLRGLPRGNDQKIGGQKASVDYRGIASSVGAALFPYKNYQDYSRILKGLGDQTQSPKCAPQIASTTSHENYSIQVGAFSTKAYAQRLILRLKKKGYASYRVDSPQQEEMFYQVKVGPYARRDLAEAIARQLAQNEKLPTLITPGAPGQE